MAFILACFSVCFRGNHIHLYQIETVPAIDLVDYYRLWALGYSKSIPADL